MFQFPPQQAVNPIIFSCSAIGMAAAPPPTTSTPRIFNSCFSSSAIRKQTIYLGKNNRNSGRRTDVSAWQMLRGEASTMRSYLSSKHLAPHPWRKTLIKKTAFSDSVVLKYGFLGAYNGILSQLKAPWARGKFRQEGLEKETKSFNIRIYPIPSNPSIHPLIAPRCYIHQWGVIWTLLISRVVFAFLESIIIITRRLAQFITRMFLNNNTFLYQILSLASRLIKPFCCQPGDKNNWLVKYV